MDHHHRHRSLRLKDYDYSQAGAYFLTICVEHRLCHPGRMQDADVQLAPPGEIAHSDPVV